MDVQSILVIVLVLAAAVYLAFKYFNKARSATGKGECSSDCGCDSGGSKRKDFS